MFWVIRWSDLKTNDDHFIVVEAESRVAARTIAIKRDIPVVHMAEANDAEVEAAREANLLWRYTRPPGRRCFGQPVSSGQLACLMLCGIWTIAVILQSYGVVSRFPLPWQG
jgi:hypothetical protein